MRHEIDRIRARETSGRMGENMYRSISGEPGQGPGLVNWLAVKTVQSCRI